ncbi:MAG: SET domain-containing protein-lysine N-methyltransferase [Bacteroidota bacterium]
MSPVKPTRTKGKLITRGKENLEVRVSAGKGRGVFTNKAIASGNLVEECPILMIEIESLSQFEGFKLGFYIFGFDNDPMKAAMLLGFGSLYNHASPSNAEAYYNEEKMTFSIKAIRDIRKNEEIMINYNGAFDHPGTMHFLEYLEEVK